MEETGFEHRQSGSRVCVLNPNPLTLSHVLTNLSHIARSKIVTPDSILLDSKNPLTNYIVHPKGNSKILEEAITEIKELWL